MRSDAGPLDLEQGLKSYANRMLEHSLQNDMIGVNRLIQSEAHRFPELANAAMEKNQLDIRRIAEFNRHQSGHALKLWCWPKSL